MYLPRNNLKIFKIDYCSIQIIYSVYSFAKTRKIKINVKCQRNMLEAFLVIL